MEMGGQVQNGGPGGGTLQDAHLVEGRAGGGRAGRNEEGSYYSALLYLSYALRPCAGVLFCCLLLSCMRVCVCRTIWRIRLLLVCFFAWLTQLAVG